jgi:hypothetical protein
VTVRPSPRPDAEGPWLTAPRLALWGVASVLAIGALWRAPVSPVALLRADELLAEGLPIAAAVHLQHIAQQNPLPAVRRGASERLLSLYLGDLNNPLGARLLLQDMVGDPARSPSERAAMWERLARLLQVRFDDPEEAAGAWRMAWEADRADPHAVWRRVEGLQIMTDIGRGEDVFREWENVQRDAPEARAVALLNLAQIELGRNLYGNARERFRDARAAAAEGTELQQLADEGVEIVEKRFAMREEALSRAAAADLPAKIRAQLEKASRNAPLGEEEGSAPP